MARWADIPVAAAHLATSERHLRRLVYERRVPFTKLGGKVRFDLDELDKFLAGDTRPVVDQRPGAPVVGHRGNSLRSAS